MHPWNATYQAASHTLDPWRRVLSMTALGGPSRRPQGLLGDRGRASRATPLPPNYVITRDTTEIMTSKLLRMDNVGIVVKSLDDAISFFVELGLTLEGANHG